MTAIISAMMSGIKRLQLAIGRPMTTAAAPLSQELHNEVEPSFSGTNLMGKFTQSVKRIVQEVKEDGTQGKCINFDCMCT